MKLLWNTLLFIVVNLYVANVHAATYEVGTDVGQLSTIGAVPWATLAAGDTVLIHWRAAPYKEKWVICRQGTSGSPITIRGVANGSGTLPVIDGNNAITPTNLDYWNEERSVIKIGGASTPVDTIPKYITIENLDIRSARPAYSFTNDSGNPSTYGSNAASIHIERGQHITIRNCTLRDSGNGLFCGIDSGDTQDVVIEKCHIYNNGIDGSIYEHNSYTAAVGITFQYNRYGPLRSGCLGNNLKDRSVGTVVRYNWIESGNRQLDLVDCEDDASLVSDPDYRSTYVYGNVLIEPDSGNRQIIHYGGDSGDTSIYRKGTLYLYNNTIISTRAERTTLVRLSSNDENCDAYNNIIYVTATGSELELLSSGGGTLNIKNNWIKTGYVSHHSAASGSVINNLGGNLNGSDPGFTNIGAQNFYLLASSSCLNAGTNVSGVTISKEYVKHQGSQNRPSAGTIDLGAIERVSDSTRRLITLVLPVDNAADISPSGSASTSGNTYTFSDLNPTDSHSLSISPTGIN